MIPSAAPSPATQRSSPHLKRAPGHHGHGLRIAAVLLAGALCSCAASTSELRGAPPAPASAASSTTANGAPIAQWKHDWARSAVFYQIFVRSFADSNDDGIGDLNGLTSKLDYLRDLGIDALWLTPIFNSPSYHGYDTIDYESIHPAYGTLADFDRLLQEAHRRGIRIVLDLVINHTSSQHPWFIEAASSASAPRRDWYVWRPDDPGWVQPWGGDHHTWHEKNGAYFYGIFWSGMPDLNLRNKAVRAEVMRLADLWLARGVDGFRLDAARHIIETGPDQGQCDSPETHAFWKEFSAHVRSTRPEAVLFGENWTETPIIATYFGSTAKIASGDELPMNFDFPLAKQILEGVKGGEAMAIAAKLAEIQRVYPPSVADAPFLTNHDNVRVATELQNDARSMRSAAAILLTLPGAPFLYYGEEIGLQNGPTPNDEAKRTPMPWDGSEGSGFTRGKPWFPFAPGKEKANVAAEVRDPDSLLQRYRRLIHVRKASAALRSGGLKLLTAQGHPSPVLAFLREASDERVLVVHNLGDAQAAAGPFPIGAATLEKLFTDPGTAEPSASAGAWKISLPGHATGIWRAH